MRPPKPAELSAEARRLLESASLEVSARELRAASPAALDYCRGKQVFLPWTPKLAPEDMVEATSLARGLGLLPVPHVVARRIASESSARALLASLQGAGADAVLMIGGDVREPAGPYASSLELLRSGLLGAAGIRRIGVAGYPEGHPSIPGDALRENLDCKLEYAQREGISAFIVSQFCFEGPVIVRWAEQLRAQGVTVPLRAGLAGPTNLAKLVQLGLRCGVGNSIRALRGRMGSMVRLVATYEPEDLIGDLAEANLATVSPQTLSVHFFAFGGLELTQRWIARMADQGLAPGTGLNGVGGER